MTNPVEDISRRASLGMLLAGTAGACAAAGPGPVEADSMPENARTRVEDYVRIRSRLDGRQIFMPYHATIFGKPEGKLAVPLFDVEGFSWSRATRLAEARYRLDGVEAGYFIDRVSGKVLDTWVNPLNGLDTKVKPYRSWSHMMVSADGLEPVVDGPPRPGAVFSASMGSPTIIGNRVWTHEDLIVQFPGRPKESFADPLEYFGPILTATSLATWSADLADLRNRRLAFVPSMLSYQTLGNWRPFMRMGSTPGLISWRMYGVKRPSLDGVPKDLRDRVLADYPDFLTKTTAS